MQSLFSTMGEKFKPETNDTMKYPTSNISDLYEKARIAHYWTSFSPDVRGKQLIAEFQELISSDITVLEDNGHTEEHINEYIARFRQKLCSWLSAKSNCASTMITGGSNFSVRRNEKANKTEQNRYEEFTQWREKALKKPTQPITLDSELQKAINDLEGCKRNHELMIAANKAIRSKKDVTAKLLELGLSEKICEELQKPDWCGRIGFASFSLTNNNANIKRLEQRVKELSEKETLREAEKEGTKEADTFTFDGGRIEINREADRVQIIHNEKPDSSVIAKLKSNGWRWSPSFGAWQRKLTQQAIYDAKHLLRDKM